MILLVLYINGFISTIYKWFSIISLRGVLIDYPVPENLVLSYSKLKEYGPQLQATGYMTML